MVVFQNYSKCLGGPNKVLFTYTVDNTTKIIYTYFALTIDDINTIFKVILEVCLLEHYLFDFFEYFL